jgi:hypothetical protein
VIRPSKTAVRRVAVWAGLLAAGLWIPASFAWPGGVGVEEAHESSSPVDLELTSNRAGDMPAHRLTVSVAAGDPEIYRATIEYPAGFTLRGFGADDGAVGAFEIDLDGDGEADRVAPLVAVGSRAAFADLTGEGIYSADIEPGIQLLGGTALELLLPFGGDANSATLVAPVAARMSLLLAPGILQSPSLGGRYTVNARVTSVDPDGDGPDDGFGVAPAIREFELPVVIDGPRLVPFANLAVRDFDLHLRGRQADRFEFEGRYVLGRRSNGIDPSTEPITVTVGSFRQTISAEALVATGHGYRFRGRPPGIVAFVLGKDGRFAVDARRLHWVADRRHPVRVGLQIGDDTGVTVVNRRGFGHDDR